MKHLFCTVQHLWFEMHLKFSDLYLLEIAPIGLNSTRIAVAIGLVKLEFKFPTKIGLAIFQILDIRR